MVQSGKIRGRREYWMAVQTILDNTTQVDIFGDLAPKASDEEIKAVSRMEQKIDSVVSMVATGWKDGECVIASKVAPDKARLMSDKIAAIKKALSVMEAQLRDASAQVAIVMQAAE